MSVTRTNLTELGGCVDDWHTNLVERLRGEHPDVRLWTSYNDYTGVLVVSSIVVPAEHRNRGTGTQIMRELLAEADLCGVPVALTPDAAFGGSKARLTRWYRSLGFRPNTGRGRNLMIKETMIRPPGGGP